MKRTILTAVALAGLVTLGLIALQPAHAQKTGPMAKSQAELDVVKALFAAAHGSGPDARGRRPALHGPQSRYG